MGSILNYERSREFNYSKKFGYFVINEAISPRGDSPLLIFGAFFPSQEVRIEAGMAIYGTMAIEINKALMNTDRDIHAVLVLENSSYMQVDGAVKYGCMGDIHGMLNVERCSEDILLDIYCIFATTEELIQAINVRMIDPAPDDEAFAAMLYNVGNIIAKDVGHFDRAIEVYKAVLDFSPQFASAYNNIATCHKRMGDIESADKSYNQILLINPDDLTPFIRLCLLWGEAGEKQKVLHYLEKFKLAGGDYNHIIDYTNSGTTGGPELKAAIDYYW